MIKNRGKNLSKKLRAKYNPGMLACVTKVFDLPRQKLLDHAKITSELKLKTSNRATLKTAETTGDLIGNKIADKFTKNSLKSDLETDSKVEEKSKEIPKTCMSHQKKTASY